MKYPITEEDKDLLLQESLSYKMKVIVTDKNRNIIDTIYGIYNGGNLSINTESNIRRTANFTLILDETVNNIESKIESWLGLYYEVEIGVQNQRTDEYKYYPCGRYCITSTSTNYNATVNEISFNLSDRIAELDGTRNGQMGGALIITIPKEIDGKKQTLRGSTINILTSSTNVDKYIIDDIGEYYGMPQNNPDYEDYRKKNDEWNMLPYDLEYSAGDTIGKMLFDIRDLYPNCQMYFDVYDNFCFDMIPSSENDIPDMDNDYIQKILLADNSESVTYDVQSIKNVTEVFGKDYDVTYVGGDAEYIDESYHISIENYGNDYSKSDIISFIPLSTCSENPCVRINSLDSIPIYYEYSETPLSPNELTNGNTYVFKVYKTTTGAFCAYYLGQYQPHALCVLTNSEQDPKYTKDYFSRVYNVKQDNIYFRVQPFSPFTVQKYGEVLDFKSGNEFDSILSDSIAIQNAKYCNRNSSTMFDTVTINTVLIPWLDVNVKINYAKLQENKVYSYIVKSINHNFDSGNSEITMYRFMQLYE